MTTHNRDFSRRKFMATSLGCLASAGLAGFDPSLVRADDKEPSPGKSDGGIICRKLGRTDLEIPIISMGALACNDPTLVQACYEIGMRHFSTSANFGYGRNEQMVGNALHQLGVRDKVIIGTKVLTNAQRDGLAPEDTKRTVFDILEGSLKRLKTDYVDILCLYDARSPEPVRDEAIVDALSQAKKEGKTRFLGVATHTDMANVINAAVEVGVYDMVQTVVNFTMGDDTALLGAIDNAAAKGLGIVAMKTLAGGNPLPNPTTLGQYSRSIINPAAIKWVLHNENVTTVIPGIGNFEHMRENFAIASDIEYTEEEAKFLSDNRLTLGTAFCRQCSKCVPGCPKNVDIPNLMRTHMYAAQYADFQLARTTIDEIASGRGLPECVSCGSCTAQCVNAVDIKYNIENLKLIYA